MRRHALFLLATVLALAPPPSAPATGRSPRTSRVTRRSPATPTRTGPSCPTATATTAPTACGIPGPTPRSSAATPGFWTGGNQEPPCLGTVLAGRLPVPVSFSSSACSTRGTATRASTPGPRQRAQLQEGRQAGPVRPVARRVAGRPGEVLPRPEGLRRADRRRRPAEFHNPKFDPGKWDVKR